MGLKKKSKVSAEFSMSSLTDIIFLLLIFFMLTSSLIIPNALNLKLPGRNQSTTPPPNTKPNMVTIESKGTYYLNGNKVSLSSLRSGILDIKKGKTKMSLIITPDDKVPNEYVVAVMDICYRYGVEAVLTDPK